MAGEIFHPNITGAFDWGTLLDGLMRLEQVRLSRLEYREQIIDKKLKALSDLKSKLEDLYDFTSSINKTDWFNKKKLENLNPDVVDAKLISNNIPEYTVQGRVTKVATIEIGHFSKEYESPDSQLDPQHPNKEYTLKLQYKKDGEVLEKRIVFKGSETLQQLIDKINNDPDISPYTHAYAMYTGKGYRLALMETDVKNSSVESTSGSCNERPHELLGRYCVMQGAKNSEIKIGTEKYEDPGYTFSDVIPGVKLTVKKKGEFTLKVETDYKGIAKVFVDLVNKINNAIRTINKLTAIKKEGNKVEGPQISDYSLKELKIRLQRLVEPLMTNEKTAKYNIVDFNPDDGTIVINQSQLEKFLKENPKKDWDVLYNVVKSAKELSNLATNEAYVAPLIKGYQNEKRRLEERISEYEEYLKHKEEFLKKRFARIETYIASLQNVQTKINQILTAQMLLSR